MPLYHYVITRADLTAGQQAAHICHAAAQSSNGLHDSQTHAVVLTTPNELLLRSLFLSLEDLKIVNTPIMENKELMAIGLLPTRDRSVIRKLTSSLPLLRSSQCDSRKTLDPVVKSQGEHQCADRLMQDGCLVKQAADAESSPAPRTILPLG